ncbi:MAG: hypothetical protein JSR59_05160 [Proteobacteria bacterium]|nr:hypothetical protein [Pseudomonadota bacterium]
MSITTTTLRHVIAAIGTSVCLAAAAPAMAKCTVTLKFKNANADKVTVRGDDSQSRVNGGWWSKMDFSNTTIAAGATGSVPWTTDMSCSGNAKRDLRFKYEDDKNNQVFEEMIDNIDLADGQTVDVTLKF